MKKSHNKPARGSAKEAKAIQEKKLRNADKYFSEGEAAYQFRKLYEKKETCQRP